MAVRHFFCLCYVAADFTLECNDARWNQYLPLAVVGLLLYPIGIPAFLFVALFRIRKRLHEPARLLAWGIVYEGMGVLHFESSFFA